MLCADRRARRVGLFQRAARADERWKLDHAIVRTSIRFVAAYRVHVQLFKAVEEAGGANCRSARCVSVWSMRTGILQSPSRYLFSF
jgi:hypothetical protein